MEENEKICQPEPTAGAPFHFRTDVAHFRPVRRGQNELSPQSGRNANSISFC